MTNIANETSFEEEGKGDEHEDDNLAILIFLADFIRSIRARSLLANSPISLTIFLSATASNEGCLGGLGGFEDFLFLFSYSLTQSC